MMLSRSKIIPLFNTCLCLLLQYFLAFNAAALDLNPDQIRWSKLSYSASKFLISMNSEVHFQRTTAENFLPELVSVPQGNTKNPGVGDTFKLSLQTDLLGRHSNVGLWLLPDASVLQRTSLSTGRKDRYRINRYAPEGVYSTRHYPLDSNEEKKNHDQWTSVRESYYELPEVEQTLPISESEGLFYLLGAANLNKPGDSLKTFIFDEEGTIQVQLEVVEVVNLKVAFTEESNGKQTRVKGKLNTLRIHVSASSYGQGAGNTDFEFLGVSEDIDFYLDPVRRVIVQISGKIDNLGKVKIRLKEIKYAE